MPTSYEIDPTRSLVVSRAWGLLTDAEVGDHYRDLRADPGFNPAFRQLADLREVTGISASAATIDDVAHWRVFAPGARRAFVVATPVQFGMARMFGTYAEAVEQVVEVFWDPREAERWLGLPDGAREQGG
jgi:hypothetical protein